MGELFSHYPVKIKASTQHAEKYFVIQNSLYAVHGEIPPPCKAAIMVVIEEGKIVVCKGNPDELPPSVDPGAITPVYSLQPSGPLAVPTGRILVRFADGILAVSRRHAIQRIGYIIDQELHYVPHALWVKSTNGDIAFALNNISLLEGLSEVEYVEPQMLMESVRRRAGSRPV